MSLQLRWVAEPDLDRVAETRASLFTWIAFDPHNPVGRLNPEDINGGRSAMPRSGRYCQSPISETGDNPSTSRESCSGLPTIPAPPASISRSRSAR